MLKWFVLQNYVVLFTLYLPRRCFVRREGQLKGYCISIVNYAFEQTIPGLLKKKKKRQIAELKYHLSQHIFQEHRKQRIKEKKKWEQGQTYDKINTFDT